MENCWIVLSEIMAHAVGGTLYLERDVRRPVVIRNTTSTPFTTSDQPILNVARQPGNEIENLAFYYPLSPTTAFVLTDVDGVSPYSTQNLTEADVRGLNERIARNSYTQVFGASAAALQPFLDHRTDHD